MPRSIRSDVCVFVSILFASATLAAQTPNAVTAIRAGRLIDPDTGRATIIDLSKMTVLPGLVDAHNHLALTYKPDPENNFYYLTYVMDSTALRAIQAVSNGIQMLDAGFTIVRDLGNNGNYADTALRQGIEQGWIPGPTIINSGLIIGGMGGQFYPTPEMAKDHAIVYPEYLDADTPDEIRLVIREVAKAGLKVAGHVQTANGAKNAIEAGIWSIEHGNALTDDLHKRMTQKGIWRAGTDTPDTLAGHPVTPQAYQRTVAGLKNAYDNKVLLTFSTDADYFVQGKTRGEVCMEFLKTWKDAGIPPAEILRAMTTNGYKVTDLDKMRGPIKAGFFADLIAVPGDPLQDIDALKNVQFVMKDGQVFKQDGVMTPAAFFHGGPVNGWRIR